LAFTQLHRGHIRNMTVPAGTDFGIKAAIGPFEDGAELITISVDPPTADVNYDFELFVTVCITHPVGPNGIGFTEVVPFMEWMIHEVWTVCDVVSRAATNT
jgi:hypothetical protein